MKIDFIYLCNVCVKFNKTYSIKLYNNCLDYLSIISDVAIIGKSEAPKTQLASEPSDNPETIFTEGFFLLVLCTFIIYLFITYFNL